MAENKAVWGIDIGQYGLKAVRLKYAESAQQALVVAYDYIPHPKILSQPDAVPKDLIRQALQTFLSRNEIKGDLISISLPGNTALARFIQLPPVESSKVADVVKYEARQQIPFALEDVVWDFQTLGGGIEESGFMLGAEVGLFAMKREQVAEAMKPFEEAKVEVELVQIAPLALYNFLCYDQYGVRLGADETTLDGFNVVLDMGTDNTTLLITNGEKIWIRNVPVGGNHFTRALLKEMKLTFAKAEHLKCNATKSPDPRAVFQALRPVFNDYVAEIQRSIGYFSSVNRDSKITKVIGVGNGFKLAGLQKFLQQNLQYEVERVETFKAVIGDAVLNAPVFQENILSFVVPYGLALQTLKLTKIHTTLLPPEIARARRIRRKKPWATTTSAVLLAGLALSTAGYANVYKSVSKDKYGAAEKAVSDLKGEFGASQTKYDGTKAEHAKLVEEGEGLVTYVDTRELWPEMLRAVNECLPRPVANQLDEKDIKKIPVLRIKAVKMKRYADLKTWFDALPAASKNDLSETPAAAVAAPGATTPPPAAAPTVAPPAGPGYVITLTGEHFFYPENDRTKGGPGFVRDTLITNLRKPVHRAEGSGGDPVAVGLLGISHPVIGSRIQDKVDWFPSGPPKSATSGMGGSNPMAPGIGFRPPAPMVTPGNQDPKTKTGNEPVAIDRLKFEVQFAWKPTPVKKRTALTPPAATPDPAAQVGAPAVATPPANGTPAVPVTPMPGAVAPVTPAAPATTPPVNGQPATAVPNPGTTAPPVQPNGVPAVQPATAPPTNPAAPAAQAEQPTLGK